MEPADFEQANVLYLGDTLSSTAGGDDPKEHYHAVFGEANKWTVPENLSVTDTMVNVSVVFENGGTQQLECMGGSIVVATRLSAQDLATVEESVQSRESVFSHFLPKSKNNNRKPPGNVVLGRWSTEPNAKAVFAQPPKHMCLSEEKTPVALHDRLNETPTTVRARLAVLNMDGLHSWHRTDKTFDLPCVMAAHGDYMVVSNARGSPMQLLRLGLKPRCVWVHRLYETFGDRYRITRLIMTTHYIIAVMVVADCPTPALRFWRFDSSPTPGDAGYKPPQPLDHVLTVNDFILRVVEHPESPLNHLILALSSGRVVVVPMRPKTKMYTVPKSNVMDTVAPVTRLYVPKVGPLCYAITAMGVQVLMIPPPEFGLPITRLGTMYVPSVAHVCSHRGVLAMVTHDGRSFITVVGNFNVQELPALARRARYALDRKRNYGSTCDRAIHMDGERIVIAYPNGAIRTIKLKD